MKKSIAILLLIAISFQSFSKVFIVVNFIVNQSTIAQKYCVNKAKPKLHCDGKCHLKKQLKEEDKKENNISSNELKEKAEAHFFVEISYSFVTRRGNSISVFNDFAIMRIVKNKFIFQ